MILICDSVVSDRAVGLREKIISLGCPCAVSEITEIRSYLPLKLIITFCDVFDSVRRTPFDDVFVIAIGNGFVNTALNAKRADDVDHAILQARQYLYRSAGIENEDITSSGVFASSLFFGERFFEIYGNMVEPTETEYMIFKYLVSSASKNHCAAADKIRRFCYPFSDEDISSNLISAHISNLNRKIVNAYGKKLVHSKRFMGYYFELK